MGQDRKAWFYQDFRAAQCAELKIGEFRKQKPSKR
jgi:hypothetical protein